MRGKPPLMTPFFDGANIVTDPSWIRWFMGDDSYTEISAEYLDSGRIILSEASGDLDDIPDGSNYGKILRAGISEGAVLLSSASGTLDDIVDGSSYGKILLTDISAGHILLASCSGDLDDIADGTNYGRIASTYISAGQIILAGIADAGALAAQDTVDWTTDIDNIPDGINTPAPTIAGLYLTSSYLGYYDGTSPYNASGWKAFISSTGDFGFDGDANNYISWDGNTLEIAGDIVIKGGSGIGNLTDAGALASLDDIGVWNGNINPYYALWTSTNPDGFGTEGSPTITEETTIKPTWATRTAKIVAGASTGYLRTTHTATDLTRSTLISGSAYVYATVADKVRLRIWDTDGTNITESFSDYHPGDSAWHLLTIDGHTIQDDATTYSGGVEVAAGATGYMIGWSIVYGGRAPRSVLPRAWLNSSSGFQNTGSYLGFYRSDGWRVYLDNSGNFICRTDSGAYAFRYYGTASGSYGEGDVFIGSSTAGEGSLWWDQSAKYFTMDGSFRVISGGDIILIGAASDPGKITWYGSSYSVDAYMSATGGQFNIRPSNTSKATNLYIGDTSNPFNIVGTDAYSGNFMRAYYSSNYQAYMHCAADSSSAEWKATITEGGTARSLIFTLLGSNWTLYPTTNNSIDCAQDSYAWRNIYYYTAYDKCSILDDLDDIEIIKTIKPLEKDGVIIRDDFGFPKMDLAAMPDYLTNRKMLPSDLTDEERQERTYRNPGMMLDLAIGGIKQLAIKVDEVMSRIQVLEASTEYADILRRLEALENGRTEDVT